MSLAAERFMMNQLQGIALEALDTIVGGRHEVGASIPVSVIDKSNFWGSTYRGVCKVTGQDEVSCNVPGIGK